MQGTVILAIALFCQLDEKEANILLPPSSGSQILLERATAVAARGGLQETAGQGKDGDGEDRVRNHQMPSSHFII